MWRRGLRVALAASALLCAGSARAAEPAADATSGIWGTVRANGIPVAGARVTAHRTARPNLFSDVRTTFDVVALPQLDAAPTAQAVTDATGMFALPDLAPGYYTVEAGAAEGSACGLSSSLWVDPAAWTPAVVPIAPSNTVEGRFVDAGGGPFAGVVVLAVDDPSQAITPIHARRSARTDERGAFRLERVPVGHWRVFAAHPGRDWVALDALLLDGKRALERRVPPSTSRRLRVVDEEKRPVAGARVAGYDPSLYRDAWAAGGTTDADGFVDLPHLGGRKAAVVVEAPGRAPRWIQAQDEIVLSARARAGGRVVGRVEDEQGRPVEGVAITVLEGGGAFMLRRAGPVVSGADGQFTTAALEPGPAWIAALGAGYAGARMSDLSEPPRGAELFKVPVGGDVVRTVRVRRAASVEGAVLDEDRRPIQGALVTWRDSDNIGRGSEFAPTAEAGVATGADGTFGIRSLPAGTTVALSVTAPGFLTGEERVDLGVPGSVARKVRVELAHARFVAVRVRLGREPAVNAAVRVSHESGGFNTGLDGRVILGPLPRGPLRVEVTHHESPSRFEVTVPAGSDAAVDADLAIGFAIAGRVVDAAGKGVALAAIRAEPRVPGKPSRLDERFQIAEEGGEFRFTGLTEGTWRLTAGPEGSQTTLDVPAGASDVTLRLAPGAPKTNVVEVRVVGPDGKPVPRASIRWSSGGGSGYGNVADGVREIEFVTNPQGMTIEVGYARDADDAPLPFGPARVGPLGRGDRKVEIRLSPGRAISGRVTAPPGASVEHVEIVAVRTPWGEGKNDEPIVLGSAKASADGAFSLFGVEDEEAVLLVRPRDRDEPLGLPTRVTARAGEVGVSLPLVARVAATVTVLEETGRGAAKLTVQAQRLDDPLHGGDRPKARTDENGRGRLEGLVPGAPYHLYVIRERNDGPAIAERKPWTPADTVLRIGPASVVRGVVRDRAALAVVGAAVLAKKNGEWVGLAGSEADGAFAVSVPAVGAVDVQALPEFDLWNDGFVEMDLASPVAAAVAPGAFVTLVVGHGVRASFRVVGETDPDAWATLSARLTREKEPWDPEASDGNVTIEHGGIAQLPPLLAGAHYRFWLPAGRTGRCALQSFVAAEGLVLDVRPVPAGSVRGRVRLPEGGARPRVTVAGHGFWLGEQTEADGTFVVEGVPTGEPFEVTASTRVGGVEWTARVASRAGAEVALEPAAPRPR